MIKKIFLFLTKYGFIFSILICGLGILYLLWKLNNPSQRVQDLLDLGIRTIKSDKNIVDTFGVIKSTSLDSDEIGMEAGTRKQTPGEARIVVKIKGEKKDGYVKIFFIYRSSKWLYQKHEIM